MGKKSDGQMTHGKPLPSVMESEKKMAPDIPRARRLLTSMGSEDLFETLGLNNSDMAES